MVSGRVLVLMGETMLVYLMLMCGCGHENQLKGRDDVEGASDWPKIVVTPNPLNFGVLGYMEGGDLAMTIRNEGTDNSILTVSSVDLVVGDEEGFSIFEVPEGFDLHFGEEREVTVQFLSYAPGERLGEIVVHSDDEQSPALPVPLLAAGIMPMLDVSPDPLAYAETTVGCERPGTFTLTNVGTQDLVVSEIASIGMEFPILERPILPLTLAPERSADVHVAFVPSLGGDRAGEIAVMSNDPRGAVSAGQLGPAVTPGKYYDSFMIPYRGAIDLMFIVDQSFSMTDEQAMLAANATAFANGLSSVTDDWQLLVVPRDDGCNVGGILRADTPDYAATFAAAVQDGADSDMSEAGIYRSYLAATQTGPGQCNEGFVRPEALLHIVYISDEYDGSEELTRVPWYSYINDLRALKGASYLVKASAVAGDMPSGCDSPTNHAGPAVGYYDAVEATHGGFISICSDWSTSVSTVATYGVSRDTYGLSHVPDESTIEVFMNGVLRTSGWHYMSDSNAVVFSGAIPQSGDVVEIGFTVPYTCE